MEISFIIPCYNCARTIVETVNSILAIGLARFEICLVDDASTDNTWKILNDYQRRYPKNIKISKNQQNHGGGATRNFCFGLSIYDHIFCLDSDNIIDARKFKYFLSQLAEDDDMTAFGNIRFFINFGNLKFVYKNWHFLKTAMGFDDLRKTGEHPVASGNYLFKREVFKTIGGYETDLGALDAYSFGYKALVHGYRIRIIPDTSYFHRIHRNSYWVREDNNNSENLKKLLLRYPSKFTQDEVSLLLKTEDVNKVLYNKGNDFSRSKSRFLFRLFSSACYKIFSRP